MKLSVIIPVYNEKATIRELVRRVRNVNIPKEIIIVDDYSNDGTREILKDYAKVVYGSRQLKRHRMSYLRYHFGGRFITWVTNLLYNAGITDEPTCYKVFSVDVIKSIDLKSNGFEFCPEVTAKICKKGFKIFDVPISYEPRDLKHGKKIKGKDGLIALWVLIKYKFID